MAHPYLLATHNQISSGISDLIQSQAGVVKTQRDWLVVLFLLERIGIGATQSSNAPIWSPFFGREVKNAVPTLKPSGSHSDGSLPVETSPSVVSSLIATQNSVNDQFLSALNKFDLLVEESIQPHEPDIFFKCCKTISDQVRSDVHVSAANFSMCVHCIRTFSEVSSCGLALEHEASMGRLVNFDVMSDG